MRRVFVLPLILALGVGCTTKEERKILAYLEPGNVVRLDTLGSPVVVVERVSGDTLEAKVLGTERMRSFALDDIRGVSAVSPQEIRAILAAAGPKSQMQLEAERMNGLLQGAASDMENVPTRPPPGAGF